MLRDRYLETVRTLLLNEAYLESEAQLLFSVLCAAQGVVMDLDDFQAVRKDTRFLQDLRSARGTGDSVILEVDANGRSTADGNLRNYTEFAYTLVGRKRLEHLQYCMETVFEENIEGDFLEAGVWRGGSSIFMRAGLAAWEDNQRNVWVCDSFSGMPDSTHEADKPYAMGASRLPFLAVSLEEVKEAFRRFSLLDSQVRFVAGWFSQSLSQVSSEQLAILRIDADLHSSTMDVLQALYDKVSPGGWIIIDDYNILPPCREAVDEFRAANNIDAPIETIDAHAVCWRRS